MILRMNTNNPLGNRAHALLGSTMGASPEAIADSVIRASGVNPSAGLRDDIVAVSRAEANPGYVLWSGYAATCSAGGVSTAPPLQLVGQGAAAAGIAAGTLSLVGVASGPFAPIAMAVAGIVGLFSKIFTHHAQAVKKEQSVLCAAAPAASNYLQIIRNAVAAGQATPQQAIAALDSLASDFRSQVSSIIKMGGDQCNAACWNVLELQTAVETLKDQYSSMSAAAASSTTPAGSAQAAAGGDIAAQVSQIVAGSTNVAGTTVPNWALLAGAAMMLFMVLRG